jgi:hypothetical protein
MAFKFAYDLRGGDPIIQKFPVKDTVVLSRGEMVNLESGEVDSAATNDAALVGITVAAVDNTADGEYAYVIVNRWAVYVDENDANARTINAPLDLATGALGVTSDTNSDLKVVVTSTATEPTYVVINTGEHFMDTAS